MGEKRIKTVSVLTLVFNITFMPPAWAVLTPLIGVDTRAVALIRAGLFVTNGSRRQGTFKISLGFLLGDLWALAAVWIMKILPWNPNVELYLTLFILGGVAMIVGEILARVIYTPAWPCGWVIDLTIMGPVKVDRAGTLSIQTRIAVLVGVIYVGMSVDALQKIVVRRLMR